MRLSPRVWVGAALSAVAVVALAGCSGGSWEEKCSTNADQAIECAPEDRAPAPKVSGELLDGGQYDITQDRGQVVVVNFWGSWCPPCRAEADDLESTFAATRDQGVRFIGVNVQDSRDKAKAFEQSLGVTYPSLFDSGNRVALNFEIPPNSTPATIVLDRDGKIAAVFRKPVLQSMLQPVVARVAAEKPATGGAVTTPTSSDAGSPSAGSPSPVAR
ncbi:thiol-disulfide isomerase/thioredoxin [Micromonospora pisi]|uniref:Thiol-disulfide isomerase/thioredoxin n=1 Tax=Micromonospora pisi TaxID=589240 RepID=A0A495JLY9_9ACTN|nr:TlpA disulfide reductase family protein [Micromonospora pisi]RKR89675.1 thiol-disulfide isomerase/thioredoxin [Micromonospora pisi]